VLQPVSTGADEVDLELHEVTYDEQPSTQEEGIALTSFTDGLHDVEHDVTEFTLHNTQLIIIIISGPILPGVLK